MVELLRGIRHAIRRFARTPIFTSPPLSRWRWGSAPTPRSSASINGVLLKPLPYKDPDRLVGLWQTAPGVNIENLNASIADYLTYREESKTLADVALWHGEAVTVTDVGRARAGARDLGDLPPPADARRAPRARARVRREGRRAGQSRGRDARLRLLAAALWRRPGRHRTPHHRRRHAARGDRRPAAGLLVHGRWRTTSWCRSASIAPRSGWPATTSGRSAGCVQASRSTRPTPTSRG